MAWNCTHCHRHGNLSGSWIPPTFTSSQLQRCLEPLWSKGIWPSCPGTRRLHKRHQHRHIYPQINDPYNDRWKDITYIHLVCAICTKKKEPNHTWATLGSNLISYPEDFRATPLKCLNLPRSNQGISWKKSYRNTTSKTKPHQIDGYTCIAFEACMAFHTPAA